MHPRHINTHDAVVTAVKRLREKGNPIRLVYGETFEDLEMCIRDRKEPACASSTIHNK